MSYIMNQIESHRPITLSVSPQDLLEFVNAYEAQKALKEERMKSEEKPVKERYLSREEVAKRLRVSLTTLWRWEKTGYLVPVKVGKFSRYAMSDIVKIEEG